MLLNLMKVLSLGCPEKVRSGAMCYNFFVVVAEIAGFAENSFTCFPVFGFFFFFLPDFSEC